MFIGGLNNADAILERPGQVHSDDLVGCVHSVSINGRALNLTGPLNSRGISNTCPRSGKSACNSGISTNTIPDSSEVAGHVKPACSSSSGTALCYDRWLAVSCSCDQVIGIFFYLIYKIFIAP